MAAAAAVPARPRLRRLLLAVGFSVGALLLGVAAFAWWLLGSQGGRDLALDRLISTLPEGTLRIGERAGSLAGGLHLREVVYEDAAVRIAIDALRLQPRLPGVDAPTLHLAALRARGVDVTLKAATGEPAPPWPEMLPTLELPLAVRIDAFEVRDVVVRPPPGRAPAVDASPPLIDRVAGTLVLQRGRVAIDGLDLEAAIGRARGAVAYAPADGFATRLVLDVALVAGAHASLHVDGDLGGGRATLDGRAGGPLALAFDWRDGGRLDTLAWTLSSEARAIEMAALGLEARAPIDAALRLAGGAGGDTAPGLGVRLEGRVAQGGMVATIVDSRIRLQDRTLHVEPLALALPAGRVDLTGRYRLDDGLMALVARTGALAWGEGEARVVAAGEAVLSGTHAAWIADLDLDLVRGAQRATLVGRARGDAEAVVLAPFTLTTPGGSLAGEGRYARGEAAGFSGRARLRAFDPAWLLPGWPGRLDARVRVDGSVPAAAPWRATAVFSAIDGRLRGHHVGGQARLDVHGDALAVDADLALAGGRIAAKGALAPALDLDARLRTLDLAPWIDGARGVLDGRVHLRGRGGRPALEADLVVVDGGWNDIALRRLRVHGSLPADGEGRIEGRAEGIAQGESRIEAIDLVLDGRIDAGRFRVTAHGIVAAALPTPGDAAGGGVAAHGTWQGDDGLASGTLTLDALDASLPSLPTLALVAPAAVAWRDGDGSLPTPACLALADAGRLCAGGSLAGQRLDGEIALHLTDLSLLERLSADIVAPRGVIEGRLRLSGSPAAPRWQGAVVADPLAFELPALGIAVVDGALRIEGGEQGQLRLRGRLPTGDGALEIGGQWSDDARRSAFAIRGSDVRVLDTAEARVWISPDLEIDVAEGLATLRGRVDVPRAVLALERFEQDIGVSPDVLVIDDPPAAAAPGLRLDAAYTVALGDDVRLRGFGFDGRLAGELEVRDRPDREPRARGTLTLAGEVRAYGQRLDLEHGVLRWSRVAIDEPTIDIRAVRPDSEPEVGVAITGTGGSPVVDVWSRPPLPQAEALSWLMFGRPLASADGSDAAQLQQAAMALGGSAAVQALAGRVGFDTASIGESRSLGGTVLTVGKRVTPQLYVSYGMALSGTGQVVTVTYALRRWLSLQVEAGIEQRIELEARFERD